MSFKSFKFLEEYNRRIIKEAEELEDESTEDTENPEESSENSEEDVQSSENSAEEPKGNPEGDPEITPDVDEGFFISDIKKAEWKKLMLQALMTPKPDEMDFDEDLLNVTTENADRVIKAIRNQIKIKSVNNKLDDALSEMI